MKWLTYLFHIIIVFILTVVTQIGGILWVVVFGYFKFSNRNYKKSFKLTVYTVIYLLCTFLILPLLSTRKALPLTSDNLRPHTIITVLCNRHYVSNNLKEVLNNVSSVHSDRYPGSSVYYMDANFPFIDGFPLLPHLSHHDGDKIDLSFYYGEKNEHPCLTGYGCYVDPTGGKNPMVQYCIHKGYPYYEYSKWFALSPCKDIVFDAERTTHLLNTLTHHKNVRKILLEPHLKQQLGLTSDKIRFQGCHSVRHDDHMHVEVQ